MFIPDTNLICAKNHYQLFDSVLIDAIIPLFVCLGVHVLSHGCKSNYNHSHINHLQPYKTISIQSQPQPH